MLVPHHQRLIAANINKNMKYAALTLLIFFTAACHSGAPWMQEMMEGPPNREGTPNETLPPLYIKGWQEGCETGISANTNSFHKFFYEYRQDASLVSNDIYYRGWKDAFDYCQRYTRMYYSRQFP